MKQLKSSENIFLKKLKEKKMSVSLNKSYLSNELDDDENVMQFLLLEERGFTKIESNAFEGLGIIILDLNSNEIFKIEKNAFEGLLTLERLDLDKNCLTRLDRNVFSNLSKLNDLSVEDNQLKTIHPNTFKSLKELQELDLSKNKIIKIALPTSI